MRIAVTSDDGIHVTGHAGHCRRFWVCTVEDGEMRDRALVELAPGQSFHDSNHELPGPLAGVTMLVTGGMGAGLRARLGEIGVVVLSADQVDIEKVFATVVAGRFGDLQSGADSGACSCGSGHGHAH
jgi:predicted Fe-Mo cluster-binding NifX family protein